MLSVVAVALCASSASGQAPRGLGAVTAASTVKFSGVADVRELASGALLVADPVEEGLYLLTFGRDAAPQLGRGGRGPLEYRAARALFALPGDSTLMPDGANRRWLVLVGDWIVATIPPDHPAVRSAGTGLRGADRNGDVLSLRRARASVPRAGARVESLTVFRTRRNGGKQTVVTSLRARPEDRPAGSAGATQNPLASVAFGVPMQTAEQALLFDDGWIAAARVEPYRVDWFGPNGEIVRGAPLPYTPVRITEVEKTAYRRRVEERAGKPVQFSPSSRWPAVGSPFDGEALAAAPDGCLLIQRQRYAADTRRRYDIVDRQGKLVGSVSLPFSERIVGSGRGAVFVAVADDDGLATVRRHAWRDSAPQPCKP